MELLFDETLSVHYGFVFLSPADEEDPDLDESRRGQVNGLLGAGTGDALALTTGTHTGDVPLRIEWHDAEPALDDAWDDVVEASVDITDRDMRLAAFDDAREVRLPATGAHRVRLCATGFEAARREEDLEDDRVPDRYLLQLWPAPIAGDAIVRVSGPGAQYWHDEARNITSMPEQEWTARQEASSPPDVGGYQPWAPSVGRGLSDERLLSGIPMSLRVELREPLARRACEAVGLAGREPIRSALEALRRLAAAAGDHDEHRAGADPIANRRPTTRRRRRCSPAGHRTGRSGCARRIRRRRSGHRHGPGASAGSGEGSHRNDRRTPRSGGVRRTWLCLTVVHRPSCSGQPATAPLARHLHVGTVAGMSFIRRKTPNSAHPDWPAERRDLPTQLRAEAAANPGGSVAQIDGRQVSDPDGYVPAEAIVGVFPARSPGQPNRLVAAQPQLRSGS